MKRNEEFKKKICKLTAEYSKYNKNFTVSSYLNEIACSQGDGIRHEKKLSQENEFVYAVNTKLDFWLNLGTFPRLIKEMLDFEFETILKFEILKL